MSDCANKMQRNIGQSNTHEVNQLKRSDEHPCNLSMRDQDFRLIKTALSDGNSLGVTQLKSLQMMANNSPQAQRAAKMRTNLNIHHAAQLHPALQRKENNTALPDGLKTGKGSANFYSQNKVGRGRGI